MRKLLVVIVFVLVILTSSTTSVYAAKPRLQPVGGGGGIGFSSVKLRPDHRAALVNLFNLNLFSNVSYSLTYTSLGLEQGVAGSITPSGNTTVSRELLFGTCSKNVCTYNYNISNMHLRLTGTTKSGKSITKGYLIKV